MTSLSEINCYQVAEDMENLHCYQLDNKSEKLKLGITLLYLSLIYFIWVKIKINYERPFIYISRGGRGIMFIFGLKLNDISRHYNFRHGTD